MHAALGEPSRLAVVDRLSLGDASPGELAAVLGLSSNLLAHHLRVLSDAGLLTRGRSEGDGRRSYVGLVLDDPLVQRLVAPVPPDRPVPRVVFVCTHNSARSHLALAAFRRSSDVPADAAGTAPADRVHPRAAAAAARHGLDLSGHRTAHVRDVVREGDLVVAVCDNAYESSADHDARPALHWSVPDPVRVGSDEAFESALTQILARSDRLGRALTEHGSTT